MIGIDTNVLVRYIVQDDPDQSRAAVRFLESTCSSERPGWICLIVLCELVWVLTRAYGYRRATVADVLEQLLSTTELRVEQSTVAWRSARDFRSGNAEFADYLIGHLNAHHGVDYTITFDRRAADQDSFRHLAT